MRDARGRRGRGHLLCVANFPPNTGYAWRFIEGLYAAVADDLASWGVRTWVAYPRVEDRPESLRGSRAEPLELEVRLGSVPSVIRLLRLVQSLDIRTLYLSDRPLWHPAYAVLRAAGVRRIIVHDHSSGEREPPTGARRRLKALTRRFTPGLPDVVLAVSEFVGRRAVEVGLVPRDRVRVMLNSVEVPEEVDRSALRTLFDIPDERPLIACACRAAEYKGVHHLLEAVDLLGRRVTPRPVLVYFGEGPFLDELWRIRSGMRIPEDAIFGGYREDARQLLGGADICVVPSNWGEAFGLAALEPGARGVPVVATRMGGLPEVVLDGVTGRLVPASDPAALADAIEELIEDPEKRKLLGARARERARENFSRERQRNELARLFRQSMGDDAR